MFKLPTYTGLSLYVFIVIIHITNRSMTQIPSRYHFKEGVVEHKVFTFKIHF